MHRIILTLVSTAIIMVVSLALPVYDYYENNDNTVVIAQEGDYWCEIQHDIRVENDNFTRIEVWMNFSGPGGWNRVDWMSNFDPTWKRVGDPVEGTEGQLHELIHPVEYQPGMQIQLRGILNVDVPIECATTGWITPRGGVDPTPDPTDPPPTDTPTPEPTDPVPTEEPAPGDPPLKQTCTVKVESVKNTPDGKIEATVYVNRGDAINLPGMHTVLMNLTRNEQWTGVPASEGDEFYRTNYFDGPTDIGVYINHEIDPIVMDCGPVHIAHPSDGSNGTGGGGGNPNDNPGNGNGNSQGVGNSSEVCVIGNLHGNFDVFWVDGNNNDNPTNGKARFSNGRLTNDKALKAGRFRIYVISNDGTTVKSITFDLNADGGC